MAILKRSKKESVEKDVVQEKKVETVKKKVKKADKKTKGITKKTSMVFCRALVTEKSAGLSDSNVLIFEVSKDANKIEVKHAFKELYGATPRKVNLMNVKGKKVSFGRLSGSRKDWKKAIITLPKSVHVDVFEGI